MQSNVIPLILSSPWFKVHAFAFIPEKNKQKNEWALFTHGYTSHKGDCLNWATRLVENGVPVMIFDQPGHFLGSFEEISSWENFRDHSHELFLVAFEKLKELLNDDPTSLILGGHSLGAFQSMRALDLIEFKNYEKISVAVGIGIGQRQATHLFETAFYEKTLAVRRQLVSKHLDPKTVFSWLKTEKENMTLSHQRLHLITGEDDVVVGAGGLEAMIEILEKNHNQVTWEKPKKLPHHEPGLASAHLYAFLKNHFSWTNAV